MLFNPTWSKTFTLPHFTAWLEKQPATKRYCYSSGTACAVAKYAKAHGFTHVTITPDWILHDGGETKIPRILDYIASTGPHTYGAALQRARASV